MANTASPETEQNLQTTIACNSSSPSGGFDCNICLDNAAEPVVTLCGHLFCWPCIYKWLHLNHNISNSRQCPVCKSSVSQNSLVPLYAGKSLGEVDNVPQRPPAAAAPPPRSEYRQQLSFLGGNAVGVLPWVLGEQWMELYYSNPYQRLYCSDPRLRRHEARARRHLHRLSVFLFFCSVLCLLLF